MPLSRWKERVAEMDAKGAICGFMIVPICVCQAVVAAHAPISGRQQTAGVGQARHSVRERSYRKLTASSLEFGILPMHMFGTTRRLQLDRYEMSRNCLNVVGESHATV